MLEACGETSSALKDAAQSVIANTMAMAHAMSGDEILKNAFANDAFEHFEIAAQVAACALQFGRPGAARNLLEKISRSNSGWLNGLTPTWEGHARLFGAGAA
jgi:ferritin-like metal-binding protein YciE